MSYQNMSYRNPPIAGTPRSREYSYAAARDERLQVDPELAAAERRAGPWLIAAYFALMVFFVAVVLYGLNHQRTETGEPATASGAPAEGTSAPAPAPAPAQNPQANDQQGAAPPAGQQQQQGQQPAPRQGAQDQPKQPANGQQQQPPQNNAQPAQPQNQQPQSSQPQKQGPSGEQNAPKQ